MKKTALNTIHRASGGRMVEFAGFEMPVDYEGVTVEHLCVRNFAGLFDVSHMGEFWVKGPNALAFLQYVTSNDVSKLVLGQAQYSCFPNGKGGIVDDLLVYCWDANKYMLVVNASNIEKDWNWLVKNNTLGAELENASEKISQLALQGPKSIDILQKLTNIELDKLKYYHYTVGEVAGVKDVIISATGYTGAGGYELYFYNEYAEHLWTSLMQTGQPLGLKPIGLAARDTLRLEMGYTLYGNDIDDTTSPIEAGLGWITKFKDDKNFVDKELLWQQKQQGVSRILIGFEMIDRGIPRHGYEISNLDGQIVGLVTSGTMSPILQKGIGMAYVHPDYSLENTPLYIIIRGKKLKIQVCKRPFI